MKERNLDNLIKNVQAMIKCPHCGSSYARENIVIVGNMGDAVLVQLSCISCKMPVMATIVAKEMGFKDKSVQGLSASQNSYLRGDINHDNPITSDEMLEMHSFLSTFDGNFENLFKK